MSTCTRVVLMCHLLLYAGYYALITRSYQAAPNCSWKEGGRPHLEKARNWRTRRFPWRGSLSSRCGSKGSGSVGSRTSAASPRWSTMLGKPAE